MNLQAIKNKYQRHAEDAATVLALVEIIGAQAAEITRLRAAPPSTPAPAPATSGDGVLSGA